VELTRDSESKGKTGLKAPKFLSEKARESAQSVGGGEDKAEDLASPLGDITIDSKKAEVPVMYRSVEIKYSKFGVDDFDFG
jgi:PAB-dependent poly(A)-specific ribonuclease subunit 2